MNGRTLTIVVLAGALLVSGCSKDDTGTLAGNVTIGPLIPNLSEGEIQPTPRPEDYAAREIVVLNNSGISEIARVSIGADGSYSILLLPGVYTIDINHAGTDRVEGLPKQVTIAQGEITQLDVDIDTGLR
jgi:hypothetical protein